MCVTKEQCAILRKSEVIKENPELLTILNENEKIYSKDLDNLTDIDFLKNMLLYSMEGLIKQASEEWKADVEVKDLGNSRVRCELCGTANRYMCFITNAYNGKRMNVGSDCIKSFPNVNHKEIDKDVGKLKKQNEIAKRKAEFNKEFPFIENKINENRKKIINNPFVLPYEKEEQILAVINDIEILYKRYLDGKESDECFVKVKNKFIELNSWFDFILEFNNVVKRNILSCDLHTKKWLISKGKNNVLEKIQKNNGIINEETINHIYCYEFIYKFIDKFILFLEKNGCKLIQFDEVRINIQFTYKLKEKKHVEYPYRIDMFCSLERFMNEFGILFILDTIPKQEEILKTFMINSNVPTNEVYLLINEILKQKNYGVEYDEQYLKLYKLRKNEWYERATVRASEFFSNINVLLSKDSIRFENKLIEIFAHIKNWETKQEARDIEEARKNRKR